MIATETFIKILAAADTSDDEDMALRAAIAGALQEDGADFDVFTGRDSRRSGGATDLGHNRRAVSRPETIAARRMSLRRSKAQCRH
jgi:hypothetical protein